MQLILGEHDLTMHPGEVAEFDTHLPHWFGPAGDQPVEILSIHGSQGQRMHARAAPPRRARHDRDGLLIRRSPVVSDRMQCIG